MSSPVRTTGPDTTAAAAALQCFEEHIGSLVVVEAGDPVGIVTRSNFVHLLGSATDPETRPLREFMTSPVITIDATAPVRDGVDEMYAHDISRLVVVADGELTGVVSTDDVVRYVPQVFHRQQFASPPHEEYANRVHRATTYEKSDWEFEYACLSEESVSVGDRVTFTKSMSDQDVRAFADASGDTNPLHLDEAYAAETRLGRRIVHGTLVGGLISAALARLPGLTIYLSQDLSFLAPVEIGEEVTAVCEVVESFGRNKYELTTDVFGTDGEQVIEGEAAVLLDEPEAPADVESEALP